MQIVGLMFCLVSATAMADEATPSLVFRNVRVFDGTRVIALSTVVVRDGIIRSVGKTAASPEGVEVIDGSGKTLLPGLIDSHVHIIQAESLTEALMLGVTTELDMFMSHQLAAAIRRGDLGSTAQMADFRTAGTAVTCPGGHGTEYGLMIPTISKPEDAQAFVDARIAEGSDYIKVIYAGGRSAGVTRAVLSAVIKAAHRRDKLAVVHISTAKGAKDAIQAGADGLAHVYYRHGRSVSDLPSLIARHNAFVIPTLTVIESACGLQSGTSLAADNRFSAFLTDSALFNLKNPFPTTTNPSHSAGVKTATRAVEQLMSAGVPILAGTDAPNPGTAHGVSLHRELELLVEAGLTPTQALAAATSTPAGIFGLSDRGRIAASLRADLLLVEGDPTTDITATRNIIGVWKEGREVDRRAYEAKILRVKAAAAQTRRAPAPRGSESGLVSDFEQDMREKPSSQFGAGWMVCADDVIGGTSSAQMKVVQGGAQKSRRSLLITGKIATGAMFAWAGAMFCPGTQPFAPANLSSKEAITFWAKGDGQTYVVILYTKRRGYIPAVRTFRAEPTWKQFTFAFEEFEDTDGSDITAALFARSQKPGMFTFQIDDVRFLSATGTMTRPTHTNCASQGSD